MNLYTQIFVILVIVLFLICVISKLRREQIEFKVAFAWLGCGLVMLLFALFPGILAALANVLGIGIPLNLVIFLGILVNLILTFSITLAYSKVKDMLYRTVQNLAILEHELDEIKNSKNSEPDKLNH